MKRIKKLASILLAMVMVLGMTMTTFAADTGDTPQKPDFKIEKQDYSIYQIFTGDYSDGVLSNVKWGQNAKIPAGSAVGEKVPTTTLEELEKVYNKDDKEEDNYNLADVEQLAVITKFADLTTDALATSDKAEFTGLTPGYYLISGKVTYSEDGEFTEGVNVEETLYVVRVTDGSIVFQPKVGVPSVDKKIVDTDMTKTPDADGNYPTEEVDTNEASIGDTVSYKITGTLPTNLDVYKTYTLLFTDNLSAGLTYNNDLKVEVVNGESAVVATDYFWNNAPQSAEGNSTEIKVGIEDVKALNLIDGLTVTKDTKIVVTYSATLNKDAEIGGTVGNENDVKLNYSNNPNNSGNGATEPPTTPKEPTTPSGVTPVKKVTTFVTELKIHKVDEDGKVLANVEFALTGAGFDVKKEEREVYELDPDGTFWKLKDGTFTTTAPTVTGDETDNSDKYVSTTAKYAKVVKVTYVEDTTKPLIEQIVKTDANGDLTFTGLGAGEYVLTETGTPAGYNTLDPIEFQITFDKATDKFASNNDSIKLGENNTFTTEITNYKGSLLPSTGGIGTTIFYVVGAVLAIGAGILLVTKKRMSVR